MMSWSAGRAPLGAGGSARVLGLAIATAFAVFGGVAVAGAHADSSGGDWTRSVCPDGDTRDGRRRVHDNIYGEVHQQPRQFRRRQWSEHHRARRVPVVERVTCAEHEGAATVAGDTVRLRGLADAAGRPIIAKVTAQAPAACGRSVHSWSSSGWEAATSNESQENLTLTSGEPTTTVDTSCHASIGLSVSSPTVTAGRSTAYTVELRNNSSIGDSVSAATVTVPHSMRSVSASLPAGTHGSLTRRGNIVTLTGLRLRAGGTVRLRIIAVAPLDCGTARYLWGSAAVALKGRYVLHGGVPGRTTVVSTRCTLLFNTEPHNAAVGAQITGVDFDPAAPPVSVEVMALGRRVASSAAAITVSLAANPGETTLAGTTTLHAVVWRRPTFKGLTSARSEPATSCRHRDSRLGGAVDDFDASDTGASCQQNVTCTTNLKSDESSLQVVANPDTSAENAGSLLESVDVGAALTCGGYTPTDANWFSVNFTSDNRSKQVNYTVVEPFPGAGAIPSRT